MADLGSIAKRKPAGGYLAYKQLTVGQFRPRIGTISGTVLNASATPIARRVYLIDRSTGVLVGTGLSDATSGEFSIAAPPGIEHLTICLDQDPASLADLVQRITP